MVLIRRPQQILLLVDHARPIAWREEPYYQHLKKWALVGVDTKPRQQVLVYVKDRVIIVLPNKEIDLGSIANVEHTGDHIMVRELKTPQGRDWDAYVLPAKEAPLKRACQH